MPTTLRRVTLLLMVLGLAAAVALGAMALAGGSSGPTPAQAKARHHAVRHHARAHRSQAADTDTVQEGDQTAPDTGKSADPAEKGGAGESTAEPAGDSARDTATSGGTHECPPSCDPGETP